MTNKNEREVYCQLMGRETGFFSTKISIELDLGESKSWFESIAGKSPLADEDGETINFNSMVDALNHMAKDGWKFINAYCITVDDNNVYHYIMKKTIIE